MSKTLRELKVELSKATRALRESGTQLKRVRAEEALKIGGGNMALMKIKQAETVRRNGTWEDAAGSPINLTGYTIASRFVNAQTRAVAGTFTVTVDADQTTNPGRFLIAMTSATSAAIPPGRYEADLVATEPSGSKLPTETFQLLVEASIT
jgi:hypothetical protein